MLENGKKGTKYACNVDNIGDLIHVCMDAILNPKRTIYASNLFQKGPNMLAIENLFSRDSFRNHSHVILGLFKIKGMDHTFIRQLKIA